VFQIQMYFFKITFHTTQATCKRFTGDYFRL